jgi:hypothetical protein
VKKARYGALGIFKLAITDIVQLESNLALEAKL